MTEPPPLTAGSGSVQGEQEPGLRFEMRFEKTHWPFRRQRWVGCSLHWNHSQAEGVKGQGSAGNFPGLECRGNNDGNQKRVKEKVLENKTKRIFKMIRKTKVFRK